MSDLTTEKLEGMLTSFKNDVTKAIEDKATQQNDKANAEIAELKTKLAEVTGALKTLEDERNKGFGLPGIDNEAKRFSWSKFFIGLHKNHVATKGGDMGAAKSW